MILSFFTRYAVNGENDYNLVGPIYRAFIIRRGKSKLCTFVFLFAEDRLAEVALLDMIKG